jgi:Transcriptional regulatory protein, C terminal
MTSANSVALSKHYRLQEAGQILDHILSGNSCQIIGIGSVGKSNLMRLLLEEDVRRTKLGQNWNKYLFVYIDTNKLLQYSAWGLWELIMHQLIVALSVKESHAAEIALIDDLHKRATEVETRQLALRYLDRAISIVRQMLKLDLVFLIDEFDDLYQILPDQVFNALRALRDDHKYHLTYVISSRMGLLRMRSDKINREAFEEIITDQTVWIATYSEADSRLMVKTLLARASFKLSEIQIRALLNATGGHPGLIRTSLTVLKEKPHQIIEDLIRDERVREECRRILLSFTKNDRKALIGYFTQSPKALDPEIELRFKKIGLIGGDARDLGPFCSSILKTYVEDEHLSIGARVQIDYEKRLVWVDDRRVQNLASLEYRLLEYLEKRRGYVCTRDEIGQVLYPEEVVREGFSDNRIDSIVKRLRMQIEPNPKEPQLIKTVHGVGFRLVDAEDGNSFRNLE